jgi:hypothetical protein
MLLLSSSTDVRIPRKRMRESGGTSSEAMDDFGWCVSSGISG